MSLRTGRGGAAAASAGPLDGLDGVVATPGPGAGGWRNWRAFAGPAMLVSVGYMDPGNWGTDLQAGAQFRYGLLWVVALASAMAVVLQVLAARLGVAGGRDLAQACRAWAPAWTRWPNWIAAEVAVIACDLAEVLGSAVALNLLFHIPLPWAVALTACDVLLLLGLQRLGMRPIEALVTTLVAVIAACFFAELFVLPRTAPDFAEMGAALLRPHLGGAGMAAVAVGIVGATVMPHNLYLHSALVRTRAPPRDDEARRRAVRWNTVDTVTALTAAFFVNAAILLLAAVVFNGRAGATVAGVRYAFGPDTDWIRVAFLTLSPLLGAGGASLLFALALLASGQSSTLTGTLAGQVVMEGFVALRVQPWLRRLVTRLLAVVPAVAVILLRRGGGVNELLVLSQVVLALQLPFAMFPLLVFTGRRSVMGRWASGPWLLAAGWGSALLITAMDLYGLPDALRQAAHLLAG